MMHLNLSDLLLNLSDPTSFDSKSFLIPILWEDKSPFGPHSIFTDICFIDPIFCFWVLVTFDAKVMKILKYYVIFVYILQAKMDETEKTRKENHAIKVTKIQKNK